jgi:hypothetical protein
MLAESGAMKLGTASLSCAVAARIAPAAEGASAQAQRFFGSVKRHE